jgi:formylglycine-generating enzyme required for sulfatase activity
MHRAWVLLVLLTTPACAAIAGVDDYNAVDCVEGQCVATDSGSAAVDDGVAEVAVDTAMPDTAAPPMDAPLCTPIAASAVTLGAWSIDATEVTNAQYAAFLAAKGTDVSDQPAYCVWNTTYQPAALWPPAATRCNHPVVHVDWCDAFAYCKWAGKRLCGNPSGGAAPFDGPTATNSQWTAACTRASGSRYIYGATYIAKRCVDDAYDTTDVLQSVKAAANCRGDSAPYDALYDLNGNAAEWEDRCKESKGSDDDCRTRGGSYLQPWDHTDCAEEPTRKRKQTAADLGFRCCSL